MVKVGAALTTKTAIAGAAGALAGGAAGVGESEITGTVNPTDWGKQVVQQVNDCKAVLTPGSWHPWACRAVWQGGRNSKSASGSADPTAQVSIEEEEKQVR